MAFKPGAIFGMGGPSLFALGLVLRAMLAGALTFGVLALFARTQLYATALLLTGAAALLIADMAASIGRADMMLERFADSLAMDGLERPFLPQGFFRSTRAIDRALERMGRRRAERERREGNLEGLDLRQARHPAAGQAPGRPVG